jgi:hypothetical protein
MAEIDMTAPTVAPAEGDYGIQRNGRSVGPFKRKGGGPQSVVCFSAPCGDLWMDDGSWTSIPNFRDIIAIIPAPDSVEPDAITTVHTVERRATINEVGGGQFVVSQADGVWPFGISTSDGIGFSASKPAAIAIARAILRMAGESK